MGIGFSASERALVAQGFASLADDLPAASACFYRHLFRIDAGSRALFVTDLDQQGRKLAKTLEVVVDGLDRWGLLREAVVDLAVRHLAYGVRPEHYRSVEDALLAMLRERLGPDLTPDAEEAWRRVIDALCRTMVEAAYPPASKDDAG